MLIIPVDTIGAKICFRKLGYNFKGYFVLNACKATQKMIYFDTVYSVSLLL